MNTLAKLNFKSIKVIALNWKNCGQNSPFKEFTRQMFLESHSCMSTQSAREHSKHHAQETTEKKWN